MKVVDPSLEKGRIRVEGQSRFNDNWNPIGIKALFAQHWWVIHSVTGQRFGLATPECLHKTSARTILPTGIGTVIFRTMIESSFIPANGGDVRVGASAPTGPIHAPF
ncbi:MAG: hypothetical protein PHG00_12005 [Methylococcales bacterium]|nr:hypothetical protein [Methylococcales bacterium]